MGGVVLIAYPKLFGARIRVIDDGGVESRNTALGIAVGLACMSFAALDGERAKRLPASDNYSDFIVRHAPTTPP